MAELTLDTDLTQQQHEYLGIVKSSADSLLTIINDILDFSRIEARELTLEEINFDLRTTVEQAVGMLALHAQKKGLELVCHVPLQVPTALVGDPGRLRQVLVNLVGNAVKFTEQGEVIVRVEGKDDREEPVLSHALSKVEGEAEGEVELHFAVRDTGIGIPEDKQALIFEAFRQADGSTTRRYGGTGLGLAISQRLVGQMGGRIWVESRLDEGSTFHFTAKLRKQARARRAIARPVVDLQGLPVLVIDDNATNRLVLREMLTNWGFEVTEAEDGPAGLRELERASFPFRLVLLDVMMPEMDGFAVAERIRDDPVLKDVTVIMLSSANAYNDTARCRELGIATHLVKPVKQSALLDAIVTMLGGEERPAPVIRPTVREQWPQLRILLAEDDPVNQLVTARMLEKIGCIVQVAGNGRKAVQMLEAVDLDLVLMDVEMPEMDGFQATRTIREREAESGGHIPIIAMTAYAMKGDREKCLEVGMDAYLSKPLTSEQLYDSIELIMSPGRGGVTPLTGRRPAPIEERRPAPITTPPVDLDKALAVVGGDRGLLQEAVELFLEQVYPRRLQELREALAQQDAGEVKRAAHGLKGTVGSFGGQAVRELAYRLEMMGREGDLSGAQSVLEELETEMERFVAFWETPPLPPSPPGLGGTGGGQRGPSGGR